ncbi:sigma 54-interacting transcriptional regulator, partial [Acinetobacter baumannii]|uniref:sigma 54-interacting transcriptional regulator n=1 Tax=Acinetobacter baumannii TaxID=470 RepID=UPI002ADF6B72
ALVFIDPRSRRLRDDVDRLARQPIALLIHGESGTGKELLARYVHRESERGGLFVAVSCSDPYIGQENGFFASIVMNDQRLTPPLLTFADEERSPLSIRAKRWCLSIPDHGGCAMMSIGWRDSRLHC